MRGLDVRVSEDLRGAAVLGPQGEGSVSCLARALHSRVGKCRRDGGGGGALETRCIATQAPQATGQRGIRSPRRRGASKSHYLRLRHGFLRDTWPEHIGCFQSLNTRNNATSLIFTHSFAGYTKRLLRAGRCAGGAHARECTPGSPGGLAPARCLLPCLAHAAVLMVLGTPRRHQRARGRLAPFFFSARKLETASSG